MTKRCSKCILNESFPNINFDADGVCNYCHKWDKQWKNFDFISAENELQKIFEQIKSKKKKKYDCLVPFSGGRDSSYVLYLCKEKYHLNILAVTFNNLFMSNYAFENISTIVEKMGVDHVFVTYNPDQLKKFYSIMVKNCNEFCSICAAGINHTTQKYQALFKIPMVITGISSMVDENSPFEVNSTHPVYVRRVLQEQGCPPEEINHFVVDRHNDWPTKKRVKAKLFDNDYVEINLPDYVEWNNDEIQNTLSKVLSWKTPDEEKDHIDCQFAPVKTYLKNRQIPNFIFKQEKFSQLIRAGQMTRETALKKLEELIKVESVLPENFEEFKIFMGLKSHDIEIPAKKSHLDYISRKDIEVKETQLYKILSRLWNLSKKIR
jgi:cell fate (sporulation/competence/biofilm development) regulator YlbF (YheA/YmcA/DUF963 family)